MLSKTKLISNIRLISILLSFLLLFACSTQIPENSTFAKQGLIYRDGSKEPFTGYVVGTGRSDRLSPRLLYKKHYENGKLNGNTKYWYKNGQLESVIPYDDGKINGVVTKYYDSGQVKARVHIVDGRRGGNKGEMFWHEDGRRE